MADMKPNAVVAFSGGHGTHSMVRIARERGIEVIDLRTECPLTGKLRYQDREHAKRQLEVNRKQLNGGVDRRRENGAYECPKCGGWHLSSHYRHENTSGVDMRSRRG
jgi:predicted PP-loop superfamily ATPase